MLFLDDESRSIYHKNAPALLQVICTIFESYLSDCGAQLELIDVDKSAGMWVAMCDVPDIQWEHFVAAVDKLNKHFVRHDELQTATIENKQARLLTIRVSDPADFAHLN